MAAVSPRLGEGDKEAAFGRGGGRRARDSRLVAAISVVWSFVALLGLLVTLAVVVVVVGQMLLTELLG